MSAPSYQARVSYLASTKAIRQTEIIRFRTSRNPEDYFWQYFVPSFLSEASDIRLSGVKRSTREGWRQHVAAIQRAKSRKAETPTTTAKEDAPKAMPKKEATEQPGIVYAPRLSFNLKRKHYELIRCFPEEIQGKILTAVARYGFDRKAPNFGGLGQWKDAVIKLWNDFIVPDMRVDWLHFLSNAKNAEDQFTAAMLDAYDRRAESFKS